MAAIRNPAAFAAWQERQRQAQREAQAAQQAAMMAEIPQEAPVVEQESTPLGAFQTLWGNGRAEVIGQRSAKQHSAGNVNSAVYDLWDTGQNQNPRNPEQNPAKKNRSVGNVHSAVYDLWGDR